MTDLKTETNAVARDDNGGIEMTDVHVTTTDQDATGQDAKSKSSEKDDATGEKEEDYSLKQFFIVFFVFILGSATTLVIIYLALTVVIGKEPRSLLHLNLRPYSLKKKKKKKKKIE